MLEREVRFPASSYEQAGINLWFDIFPKTINYKKYVMN